MRGVRKCAQRGCEGGVTWSVDESDALCESVRVSVNLQCGGLYRAYL